MGTQIVARIAEALLGVMRLTEALAYCDSAHLAKHMSCTAPLAQAVIRGRVLHVKGNDAAAVEALEFAVAEAQPTGMPFYELRALEALARMETTPGPAWERLGAVLQRTRGSDQEIVELLQPRAGAPLGDIVSTPRSE